ncbi:hypothetical protein KBZ94_37720 [Streptomyces sp. RM72]|uniref:hypothetical protein n=1 Tax=Streptomyces sp. RM72 TaxID=1115510 RepID=UPI001B37B0A8|nr:hypothetical protein [Streptomyces sp. RM72]MBQ0890598.1 hypothetical protein [Streptomyces sp. RM72]
MANRTRSPERRLRRRRTAAQGTENARSAAAARIRGARAHRSTSGADTPSRAA